MRAMGVMGAALQTCGAGAEEIVFARSPWPLAARRIVEARGSSGVGIRWTQWHVRQSAYAGKAGAATGFSYRS